MIDRTIEALTALNYDNILLIVGGQAQLYQRYASETVRLVLNPDFKFTSSMGSLAMAAPYIKDDFLLVEGDTFYEYKVLKELSETKTKIALPLQKSLVVETRLLLKLAVDISPR